MFGIFNTQSITHTSVTSLHNKVIKLYKIGNLPMILSVITHFDYSSECNMDEIHFMCRLADFLLEKKIYQHYYNYILHARENKHFVREHFNDEDADVRLKLFEKIYLTDQCGFSFETYEILYNNIYKNGYTFNHFKITTPEELKRQYYDNYGNLTNAERRT